MMKFIKHVGFNCIGDLEKRLVFDAAPADEKGPAAASEKKDVPMSGPELQKAFEAAKKEYLQDRKDYLENCNKWIKGEELPIGKDKPLGAMPSPAEKEDFKRKAAIALNALQDLPDENALRSADLEKIKSYQETLTAILDENVPEKQEHVDRAKERKKEAEASKKALDAQIADAANTSHTDKVTREDTGATQIPEKQEPEQQTFELTVLKDVYENLLKKTGVEKDTNGAKDKYVSVKAYLAKLEEDLEKPVLKSQLPVLKDAIIKAIERSTQITNSLDKRVPSPQEVIVTIELIVQQKKRQFASEKTEAEILEAVHARGLKKPIEVARKKLQASGVGADNERIFRDIYEYLQSVEKKEYDKPEDKEGPAKALEQIDYWIARDLMNEKLRLVVQEKVDGMVRDGVDPKTKLDSINSTIADTMGIYNNNPPDNLEPAIKINFDKPIVLATFLDPNNATLYKIERASTGGLQVVKAEPEAKKEAKVPGENATPVAPEIVQGPAEDEAEDLTVRPAIEEAPKNEGSKAKVEFSVYENEKSEQEIALEDRDGSLLKERGVQPKYLEILTKIDDYWDENRNAATSYEFKPFGSDIVKCSVSFGRKGEVHADMFVLKYTIKGQPEVATEFGTKQQLLRKINSGELYQELMKKVLSNEDNLKSLEPKIGKISDYEMYEDRMDADCTFKLDSENSPEVKLKSLPDGRVDYTVITEPSAFKGKAENLDELAIQLAHIREWDNKKEEDKVSNKSLREEKMFSDIADKDNFVSHEKDIGRVESFKLEHDKGVNLNLRWGKDQPANVTVLIMSDGTFSCAVNYSALPPLTCANFDQVIKAIQAFRAKSLEEKTDKS